MERREDSRLKLFTLNVIQRWELISMQRDVLQREDVAAIQWEGTCASDPK